MTELETLSLDELLSLQARVAKEIDARRAAESANAKKEVMQLAARYGLAIQFAGSVETKTKAVKAKGTVAAKYRHPQNPSLTWTGRGRSPVWVAEWKAKHGSLAGITL